MNKDPRFQELSHDPYHDGIAKQVASSLKKRGIKVRSKEGIVKRATDKLGWEVKFPQGKVEARYSVFGKEWTAGKWEPNE